MFSFRTATMGKKHHDRI